MVIITDDNNDADDDDDCTCKSQQVVTWMVYQPSCLPLSGQVQRTLHRHLQDLQVCSNHNRASPINQRGHQQRTVSI